MVEPNGRHEDRAPWLAFLLVLVAFLAVHAGELDELQHLVDEGVNVVSARRIQGGEEPYRDFMYHQLPTYLFTLALLPTDHLWYGRLLSLASLALSGAILFSIARRIDPGSALLAALLFYFASMQYYGLLALPNAPMLALALLGVRFIFYGSRPRPALGGCCLAASILYKPLTLAVLAAAVVPLLAAKRRRRELWLLALSVAAWGLLAWGAFHAASGGGFTDLLLQQRDRYAERTGLDLLREGIPAIRPRLEGLTPLGVNVLLTLRAYASTDVVLVLLALSGLRQLWRPREELRAEDRLLWTSWLVLAPAFSLFVWDLSWEHYHLLDLPPLCLLSALYLRRLVQGRRSRKRALALACAVYVAAGVNATQRRHRDYAPAIALRGVGVPLLAFDPTVNVLAKAELACGVQDFFTQRLPDFLGPAFSKFYVSSDDIVQCLDASPEIRIVIHQLNETALFFIDDELADYIARQPESRVIFLSEDARAAFDALR